MKKIPSLFMRNHESDHLIRDEITPGLEWVFLESDVIPTRKWDGIPIKIVSIPTVNSDLKTQFIYKRYDAKHGKIPPKGFIPAQEPDLITGHWPGWILFDKGKDFERLVDPTRTIYEYDANEQLAPTIYHLPDGTYEFCGPRVQNNPEKLTWNYVVKHGIHVLSDLPQYQWSFKGFRDFLAMVNIEGIVFYRLNGDMAKVKLKDYGIERT